MRGCQGHGRSTHGAGRTVGIQRANDTRHLACGRNGNVSPGGGPGPNLHHGAASHGAVGSGRAHINDALRKGRVDQRRHRHQELTSEE